MALHYNIKGKNVKVIMINNEHTIVFFIKSSDWSTAIRFYKNK